MSLATAIGFSKLAIGLVKWYARKNSLIFLTFALGSGKWSEPKILLAGGKVSFYLLGSFVLLDLEATMMKWVENLKRRTSFMIVRKKTQKKMKARGSWKNKKREMEGSKDFIVKKEIVHFLRLTLGLESWDTHSSFRGWSNSWCFHDPYFPWK